MEKKLPFVLSGKDFCLSTILKLGSNDSYILDSSSLQRIGPTTRTNISVKRILANYKSIIKCFPFSINILVLNKYDTYILSDGKILIIDNKQIGDSPLILPNSFKDNKINAEFADNILKRFNISNTGLNVITGERVWSNWFNTFTLVELLLKRDEESGYFILDTFGVWEYLLNNINKDERLTLLDKAFFKPQFTFINNYRNKIFKKGEKINLIKKHVQKSIYLLNQPFSFFDLNKDGFETFDGGYYLNRFVLIKNAKIGRITKRIYDKDIVLFSSHFYSSSKFIVSNIENAKKSVNDVVVKFLYKIKKTQKFNKNIKRGDKLVDLGFRKVDFIKFPKNAVLTVAEKQIISVGDVIYKLVRPSGSKIVTSKVAGTISLKKKGENVLMVLGDEYIVNVRSLFSGNIVSVDGMELQIRTNTYELPLFNDFTEDLYGILVDIKDIKEIKDSIYPYIVYVRSKVNKLRDVSNLSISGILIKHKGLVGDSFVKEAKKNQIKVNYINSMSSDVNNEYEKILHRCLGKYINIKNNSIIISAEDIEDFIKLIDNGVVGNKLKKGINVKFYNNESAYLYGSVEKAPHNKSDRLLISMKDGVYEANIGNILIL